jgi:hypothetical protein
MIGFSAVEATLSALWKAVPDIKPCHDGKLLLFLAFRAGATAEILPATPRRLGRSSQQLIDGRCRYGHDPRCEHINAALVQQTTYSAATPSAASSSGRA